MLAIIRNEITADLRANGILNPGVSGFLRGYFLHVGCYRLINYRFVRVLLRGPAFLRVLARLIDARASSRTGCFISPHALLAPGVILPHATGIVIGTGVRVAGGVTIYQGVTLGEGATGLGRYPRVERGATLYAGAKVIGDVRIGRRAVIGANSVVLAGIPDDAVAVGCPARVLSSPAVTPALMSLRAAS